MMMIDSRPTRSRYTMAPAGQLNRRMRLEERSVSVSSAQHQSATFTARGTVWASIEPLTGREFFESQTMKNDVTHRIIVRYRQEITPRHRLVMGARTFAIVSATNPGEVGMDHVCMCKEIV